MDNKKYKWGSPHVWLTDALLRDRWTPSKLVGIIISLASVLAPEKLQDLFQEEMDEDGYFDPTLSKNKEKLLSWLQVERKYKLTSFTAICKHFWFMIKIKDVLQNLIDAGSVRKLKTGYRANKIPHKES